MERLTREFASSFIRIRGAHSPDPGEPCAWCRLAAEQAAEAVVTNEWLRAAIGRRRGVAIDNGPGDPIEALRGRKP